MPPLEFFENLPTSVTPDLLLQTLTCCIKNRVLSHQSFVFKKKAARKRQLSDRISQLKLNFDQNCTSILETERLLSDVVEYELKEELSFYKNFECLNSEKITPHFMNLVKNSGTDEKLSDICDNNGTPFVNDVSRKEFITDFFKKIYKKDENSGTATVDDIINFLGPVANHGTVLDSKLTENEKTLLESDITLEELCKSINEANMSSAPGADGVSNRFIKKFWDYFKNPLLKLCTYCYDKGELPVYFRSANIKLIPKKGNCKEIKNWRPISLLNCFYKIVSRVFTSRLKKYMDKMTPICQKGYSSTRYCQEVLISVIERIERCNHKKVKGAALSLDIKKAFDSLSHGYMEAVFNFYNFGPKLIRWLKMLSTNRIACIKLDNDQLSDFFYLERGNAQGDTISPFLFNLGYQILLFKLDLCLQIAGIFDSRELEGAGGGADQGAHVDQQGVLGELQVQQSGRKAYAMADDCTLLVQFEEANLRTVMQVLNDFERISGLGCNVEKTVLMQVGSSDPIPPEILNIGFDIKNEMTLLGTKIKNRGLCFDSNIDTIGEKVRKQINFWNRFNLSLPGRINVAKTFLYSQINYLGSFMPFPLNSLNGISALIEGFVKGKLKIARNRLYQHLSEGESEFLT